jgi:methionyl-tRNA formyltransferase
VQKLRLAFLGTPDIACPFLAAAAKSGHEVAGVVSQPDRAAGRGMKLCCAPVNALAGELCLPAFKPASRAELHSVLAGLKPDLGVVVAYGRLIPEETLALARLGFLNVHFSLLPKYRGAAPVQRALMDGEKVTGVTLFWLDKGMDTGPVFLKREVPVQDSDDAASLFARLSAAGTELLAEGLRRAAAGEIAREPQAGEPSMAPKILPSDAKLDLSWPAERVLNRVRGLACGPRARFTMPYQGRLLTVQLLSAAPAPGPVREAAPGTVLAVEPSGGIVVKCGSGGLLVNTVKPEGKKEMRAADFLNGMRLKPGDKLA